MTTQSPFISVTAPIERAFDRVSQLLFRPFDLGKWFVIGFCAWLATLGEQAGGGGGGGGHFGGGNRGHGGNLGHELGRAWEYVLHNLYWIVPVAAAVVLIVIGLGLLFTWLSSRGKFMFLHCVALNKAEVAEPWRKFGHEANSLFLFRIVLGAIGLALTLPLLALIGVAIYPMAVEDRANVMGILLIVACVLGMILIGIVFAVIRKLTMDFVVPIMFLRAKRCLEGWREFRSLLAANSGSFVVYFLFQIVIHMVIGMGVLFVVLATCCIAGCLLALPYIGTVLFLPVLVFTRAYSLHYLAQFGPEYDVFARP